MAESSSGTENSKQPAKPKGASGLSKREENLAKQLRDNLAKRKQQSRARNTKPRKFKKTAS